MTAVNGNVSVVIQCAAGKRADAGHFMSDDGRKIVFVADPCRAPASSSVTHQRPDDIAPSGCSYRDMLIAYNRDQRAENPFGLLPALDLYQNGVYGRLAGKFGRERVFILSAGWGLISADFLTPYYDITFSSSARGEDAYKNRSRCDSGYRDFCTIPKDTSDHVVFLGGKGYVPLFCSATAGIARRTVFYNADTPPNAPGCALRRYETTTRTNWHYECAKALIDCTIVI